MAPRGCAGTGRSRHVPPARPLTFRKCSLVFLSHQEAVRRVSGNFEPGTNRELGSSHAKVLDLWSEDHAFSSDYDGDCPVLLRKVPSLVWTDAPEQKLHSVTLNTISLADLLLLSLSPSLSLCISGVSSWFWSLCFSKTSPSHTRNILPRYGRWHWAFHAQMNGCVSQTCHLCASQNLHLAVIYFIKHINKNN